MTEKTNNSSFGERGGGHSKKSTFYVTNLPNLKSGSVRGPFPLSYKVGQSIYRYFINNFTKQCNKSIIEYHSRVAAPVNHMRFSNCKYLILDMYRMFHFNSLKNKNVSSDTNNLYILKILNVKLALSYQIKAI